MRQWLGKIVTFAIAAFLLTGAGVFAWVRSAQIAITDEPTVAARFEPTPSGEFDWQKLGASSYVRNCASCHGDRGQGWDQYPPLHHVAAHARDTDEREHLLDVLIYGLDGDGRVPMPAMGHIPAAELAAVINHVLTSFGNEQVEGVELYSPDDVRTRLGQDLSPRDVHERRAAVRSRIGSATAARLIILVRCWHPRVLAPRPGPCSSHRPSAG